MTRGKYGEKAAKRRGELEAAANIDDYKTKVAKLTDENKALRERLHAQQKAHTAESKRLRAERNEGVAPTLAVVQRENADLRERLDRMKRKVRDIQQRWEHAMSAVIDHFDTEHRDECPRDRDGGRTSAVSAAMRLTGRPEDGLANVRMIDDDLASAKVDDAGKAILARARGMRGI